MLETALGGPVLAAASSAAETPGARLDPEPARNGDDRLLRLLVDPAPGADIAPLADSSPSPEQRYAAAKELIWPGAGERLIERLLATAERLNAPPHAGLLRRPDAPPGPLPQGSAGEGFGRLSTEALQRYQAVSEQAIAVQLWATQTQLSTAIAAKGLQGLNTLLKNQG